MIEFPVRFDGLADARASNARRRSKREFLRSILPETGKRRPIHDTCSRLLGMPDTATGKVVTAAAIYGQRRAAQPAIERAATTPRPGKADKVRCGMMYCCQTPRNAAVPGYSNRQST